MGRAMTKAEHKKMITLEKRGGMTSAYYLDTFCGNYTASWKASEIKEDVYKELKAREMLIK